MSHPRTPRMREFQPPQDPDFSSAEWQYPNFRMGMAMHPGSGHVFRDPYRARVPDPRVERRRLSEVELFGHLYSLRMKKILNGKMILEERFTVEVEGVNQAYVASAEVPLARLGGEIDLESGWISKEAIPRELIGFRFDRTEPARRLEMYEEEAFMPRVAASR